VRRGKSSLNTSAVAGSESSHWCWRTARRNIAQEQEHVELSDVVTVALAPGQLRVQVSEVAFDHRPIDLGLP